MIKIELQFFGGRGSGGGSGEGLPESSGGMSPKSISKEVDIWSYRHNKNNEPFVDAMNTAASRVVDDFPDLMKTTVREVNASTLKGAAARSVLGYYGDGGVALNTNYTDINKMNNTYDAAVKSGFHPSRGSKTGTEAVTYHELGHAVTDHIAKKQGKGNLDVASKMIVDEARGKTGAKAIASKISGYAQKSYAECVAEAFADYYCNGSKATKESKAIVKVAKKYA